MIGVSSCQLTGISGSVLDSGDVFLCVITSHKAPAVQEKSQAGKIRIAVKIEEKRSKLRFRATEPETNPTFWEDFPHRAEVKDQRQQERLLHYCVTHHHRGLYGANESC